MAEFQEANFNNIIRQIIKKSLFTERQIEIILNQKDILKSRFSFVTGSPPVLANILLFCSNSALNIYTCKHLSFENEA